jgi:hypothetical protein
MADLSHPSDLAEERMRVLQDAADALALHVDSGGFCQGCLVVRARLVLSPCIRARWASAVRDCLVLPEPN